MNTPTAPLSPSSPVRIKKYPNRRLYDTRLSRYVTLEDIAAMVRDGREFEIMDARSGADITRSVLTQIVMDREGQGQSLLPVGFLRQVIGLYGDNVARSLPQYLEQAMQSFTHNRERLGSAMKSAWGGLVAHSASDDASIRNLSIVENAREFLRSFQHSEPAIAGAAHGPGSSLADDPSLEKTTQALLKEIDLLKSRLAVLQQELEARQSGK